MKHVHTFNLRGIQTKQTLDLIFFPRFFHLTYLSIENMLINIRADGQNMNNRRIK